MNSFLEGRQNIARQNAPINRAIGPLPSLGVPQPQEDSSVARLPDPPQAPAPAPARVLHEKKIETVELDGIVQKILITCGCGERIEVHCGY